LAESIEQIAIETEDRDKWAHHVKIDVTSIARSESPDYGDDQTFVLKYKIYKSAAEVAANAGIVTLVAGNIFSLVAMGMTLPQTIALEKSSYTKKIDELIKDAARSNVIITHLPENNTIKFHFRPANQ
jgi:phosphoribosyl 1,2-cyclic phosphodiesterase